MADIMDLIKGQLSDGLMDQLTQQIGASDRQQTAKATNGIVEVLMGQLAKNAQNKDGASALANALDRDHDGSILDDVAGYLGGQRQAQNNRMTNGAGILKHILGGSQGGVVDMISQMSGLQKGQSGNLMAMLAPLILGSLGKAKRDNGLDAGGLGNVLGSILSGQRQQRQQRRGNPAMDLLSNFLDKDGDGNVIDDVAGMLGNLFKKKR